MNTKEIGINKDDDNKIENVYSLKKVTNKFSFIDSKSHKVNEKFPPLLYIKNEEFFSQKPITYEKIFNNFEIYKDGRLRFNEEEIINSQKGVIVDLFKTAASKILEGKSAVGISLPARIFEPRSYCERITDIFASFPHYLKLANNENSIEKLKLITTAILSGLTNSIDQRKPFNPILGETYQGKFSDGTKIYCEHISHHPPITSVLIENKIFRLNYTAVINGKVELNSIKAFNEGIINIEFLKTKEKFNAIIPILNLDGSVIGSRYVSFTGILSVWNETHKVLLNMSSESNTGLKSWISKGKTEFFKGCLYEYDKNIHNGFLLLKNNKFYDMISKFGSMKDVLKVVIEVKGNWYDNLFFGKEQYWNFKEDYLLLRLKIHDENPLPSDSRFREDLISLFYKNQEAAQYWKVIMEEQQRKDKKTRLNK